MMEHNIIWKSLDTVSPDLIVLARQALELHAFRELAQRNGLPCGEERDGDYRDWGMRVPTSRLESVLQELGSESISFGMVDCAGEKALAICHRLHIEAELIPPNA